jgi:hypothetical protein
LVVGSFECGRDQRFFFLAEANPRISNCRTAAARFGILALNRKSSIAAISSADRKTCRRRVLSGFRGVIGAPCDRGSIGFLRHPQPMLGDL